MPTNDVKTRIHLSDIQVKRFNFGNYLGFQKIVEKVQKMSVFRNQFFDFENSKWILDKNGTFLSMLTWHFQIPIRIDSKSPHHVAYVTNVHFMHVTLSQCQTSTYSIFGVSQLKQNVIDFENYISREIHHIKIILISYQGHVKFWKNLKF